MPNLKHAKEWINSADKSLETAILLNRENHYTDVIAVDIQQAVEKSLKSLYAYEGLKIPRTHSLDILFSYVSQKIQFVGIEITDIVVINDYYESERYPGPKYFQPNRSEINHALEIAETILLQVKQYYDISTD